MAMNSTHVWIFGHGLSQTDQNNATPIIVTQLSQALCKQSDQGRALLAFVLGVRGKRILLSTSLLMLLFQAFHLFSYLLPLTTHL